MISSSPILLALTLGPIQFSKPLWLLLVPVLGLAAWWIGRRSLAGLGPLTRHVALAARLLVIALIAGALAEPQLRRVSRDLAVTVVLDTSRSIPPDQQQAVDAYVAAAREQADERRDRLGVITVATDPLVQALPSPRVRRIERLSLGDRNATDLAAGLRLALAIAPEDAANRLVLISDGNETAGSLLAAAEAARARGTPVDVLPVEYDYPAEVIVDRLVAPANSRGGETLNLSVIATATRPTSGRVMLTIEGQPVDLDPDSDALGVPVMLRAGKNVLSVPIRPPRPGPLTFEAVFVPDRLAGPSRDPAGEASEALAGDAITENNRASAVTFVGSEGWVLLVSERPVEHGPLLSALREADLRVDVSPPEAVPSDLTSLNAYEAVLLVNQPAYAFSENQMESMRRYVHDSGGGLVMTGGPRSFGAGGWIGSPLEDALPVQLDPPQKRQMPRGALALVVHSVEIPNGVFWGKQVCLAAAEALSRLDLIGVVEYQFMGGVDWVYPMAQLGNGSAFRRAVNRLQFGDMPSFDSSLNLALQGLVEADAGQKHCIVISDGDPTLSPVTLTRFVSAGVTISAIGIGCHGPFVPPALEKMAETTGGEYYEVANNNAALATLPQIFIKEAQTIRRSLIWEGDAFSPRVTGVPTETMRGVSAVPAISGYVVTAERTGLAQTTLRGLEEDPVAAQWQYGLGKAVAFTSDVTTRWAPGWVSWASFKQFWEQHVRWAMRPTGSRNIRVLTEQREGRTVISIDALGEDGERLNFADFEARASGPDGSSQRVEIRQTGPGRYEGVLDTPEAGSYVVSMRYAAPGEGPGDPPLEGSVQVAVTRPFADEFRALETNTALLRQVASLTGGRVLDPDPALAELWRREGLEEPVALRPIWLAVGLAAMGLFLADVGVRRVRVDLPGIGRAVLRALGAGPGRSAEQSVESLRAARASARRRFAPEESQAEARAVSAKKFEADPSGAASTEQPPPIALSGEPEPAADQASSLGKPEAPKPKRADDEEGGMSRLMRAKRRAREELERGDDEQ